MKKIVALLLALLMMTGIALAGETTDVTVILDYIPNTNHTGMYVALERGYYAEEGLNVTIMEPTEGATNTLIAMGKGDIGVAYQEDVTLAHASEEPLPIRAIATLIRHNTSGFVSWTGKNITSVRDWAGKTYAGWGGPGEEAVIRALMEAEGLDFNTMRMVISDGNFAALQGDVDLMWFFEAWDMVTCEMNDFPLNYLSCRELDERLDYYTPVLITNETMIAEHPDTLKAFLRATRKGYADTIADPAACAEILQHYAPDYDLAMLVKSQEYLAPRFIDDSPAWGRMEESTWDRYTEFLTQYGVIGQAIPAAELMTNAFLPED